MLRAIAEGLAPNIASGTLRKLLIVGLMEVDDGELRRLQLSLDAAGMIRKRFTVTTSRTSGGRKMFNVLHMKYYTTSNVHTYMDEKMVADRVDAWLKSKSGGRN
jgi:hypothetical protein